MVSTFDPVASSFARYRELPGGVAEAVRAAMWSALRVPASSPVLDMGAGTGRFGKAFVGQNDAYVGVDLSREMLKEFHSHHETACLVQADGERLPFRDASFAAVMLMQVLSGARDWNSLILETRRVLRPSGTIVVGHTVSPKSGVDTQMKQRLRTILREMNVEWRQAGQGREQSLSMLHAISRSHLHLVAASWTAETAPQTFLARRPSGARFAALPLAVQHEALEKLSRWAQLQFGSLDTSFTEERSFELHLYQF
jgi:ubiquinone/menaquinone biosynthesis C-methylase UbiE